MTFLLQISDRSTKCRQLTFAVSILLFKVPCRDSLVIIHMHFILFLFKNVDLVLYFQRRLNKGLIMIHSLICTLIHWVFIGKLLDVRLCCSKQLRWKRHGPSPGGSYSPDKRETKQFNGRSPRPCFWQGRPLWPGLEECLGRDLHTSEHFYVGTYFWKSTSACLTQLAEELTSVCCEHSQVISWKGI